MSSISVILKNSRNKNITLTKVQ